MTIVIPMAGLGSRFPVEVWKFPKPLIPVAGVPMYRWAVQSLEPTPGERIVFILREDGFIDQLRKDIAVAFADYDTEVVVLSEVTRGQSETVLKAEHLIDREAPLIIHNADTAFALDAPLASLLDGWDGGLVVFDSTEERWSFAATDDDGVTVTRVTEKEPVSNHASTGTYVFSRAADFLDAARDALVRGETVGGEYYVAPVYNELIEAGKRYTIVNCSEVFCFGTPTDLDEAVPRFEAALHAKENER